MTHYAQSRKGLRDLISEYTDAASTHGQATESGDSATASDYAQKIADIIEKIVVHGSFGDDLLRSLLSHEDTGVRHWAASHSLRFAPEQAEAVLEEIARVKGSLVAFSASVTLRERMASRFFFGFGQPQDSRRPPSRSKNG